MLTQKNLLVKPEFASIKNFSNRSAQDFALAAKSVRTRISSQAGIRLFVEDKL